MPSIFQHYNPMRSHFHVPATYLKHFSEDPSKGRYSLLNIYDKLENKRINLQAQQVGVKKNSFSQDQEVLNGIYEKYYDHVYDAVISKDYLRDFGGITAERLFIIMMGHFITRSKEAIDFFQDLNDKYNSNYTLNDYMRNLQDIIEKGSYIFQTFDFKGEFWITCDNPVIRLSPNIPANIYLIPLNFKSLAVLIAGKTQEDCQIALDIYDNIDDRIHIVLTQTGIFEQTKRHIVYPNDNILNAVLESKKQVEDIDN